MTLGEVHEIRRQDIPAMATTLREIRAEDIPEISRSIAASNSLQARRLLQALRFEAQNTRETVIESGWTTTAEMRNIETAIGQLIISGRDDVKQQIGGLQKIYVQEFSALRGQLSSLDSSPPSQASSSDMERSTETLICGPRPQGSIRTKQAAAIQWQCTLPLGFGSISLRRELRQRVLIRVRKYITEEDTSVDTETTFILSLIPNRSLFGSTLTGCNWKFSFKTSRRISNDHPVRKAIKNNDLSAIITYFEKGILFINDVYDRNGDTLLHMAVQHRRRALCEWFVDNGLDAHATNDKLETAVHALAENPDFPRSKLNYEPLLDLLLDKCELDPNEANSDGISMMESDFFDSVSDGRFTRCVRLSISLSTEPPDYRIKQLFNAILARYPSNSSSERLKCLLDEYHRLRLPEEDESGKKWWHTPEFLRKLVKQASQDDDDNYSGLREWAEAEVIEVLRSGVCVHAKVEGQTMFEYLISDTYGTSEKAKPVRLQQWLSYIHRAGNLDVSHYLKLEQARYPGGDIPPPLFYFFGEKDQKTGQQTRNELPSEHYYSEYPSINFHYSDAQNAIEISYGIVVPDRASLEAAVPGSWELDMEIDFCNSKGWWIMYREVKEDDDDYYNRIKGLLGRYAESPNFSRDNSICDWMLRDGRPGKMYPLWVISTAGFDHGDYDYTHAAKYVRNFQEHPIWIEYPEGWVYMREASQVEWKPRVFPVDTHESLTKWRQHVDAKGYARNRAG